jgi:hypothetical protein
LGEASVHRDDGALALLALLATLAWLLAAALLLTRLGLAALLLLAGLIALLLLARLLTGILVLVHSVSFQRWRLPPAPERNQRRCAQEVPHDGLSHGRRNGLLCIRVSIGGS